MKNNNLPLHDEGDDEKRRRSLNKVQEIITNYQRGKKIPRFCSCGNYIPTSIKDFNCKYCGGEPQIVN